METTTKKTKKTSSAKKNVAEQIETSYKEYVLMHGTSPASVFSFMKDLGLKEAEFYAHYGSFDGIEQGIWRGYMENTLAALAKDKVYEEYTVREKLLAFYYTLVEVLKQDRSFVVFCMNRERRFPDLVPEFIKSFKSDYLAFSQKLVDEGVDSGEVQKRPLLTERYKDALWLQLVFVLNFWRKDESANFTQTDAAIEKSVNLSFELMSKGALDMMVDFAKFLYHNK